MLHQCKITELYSFIAILFTESESDICVFSPNQVDSCEPERQRDSCNMNRSFRRQRLQSASGHQHKNSSSLGRENNGMTAHHAVSKLNHSNTTFGINQTNFNLQTENVCNKTETDRGQPLVRNEIRNTSYR